MTEELRILTPRACWATACPPSISGAASTARRRHHRGLGLHRSRSLPARARPDDRQPADAYIRDVALVLQAGAERKIKLIISSAGGPGIDAHVDAMVGDDPRDRGRRSGWRFKLATIYRECRPGRSSTAASTRTGLVRMRAGRRADARGRRRGDQHRRADGGRALRPGAVRTAGRRHHRQRPFLRPRAACRLLHAARHRPRRVLAHGQDRGVRRRLRRAEGQGHPGDGPPRQLRPRADEPGRALHAALRRRPHALREDPARPAVRPRRRAGPPRVPLRGARRPAGARQRQRVPALGAVQREAGGRGHRRPPHHLHRRHPRPDPDRPTRQLSWTACASAPPPLTRSSRGARRR